MGTRHIISVVKDKEFKVAQYGQWDGYPDGQGAEVLGFLLSNDLGVFRKQVDNCEFMTEKMIAFINNKHGSDWAEYYPQLSRDSGSEVLTDVMNSEETISLLDQHAFAGDGLFCEWGYVIDLDTNTFEVYKGFGKEPLLETERFYGYESNSDYSPISLIKKFDLDALPTHEEFIELFETDDDGEFINIK